MAALVIRPRPPNLRTCTLSRMRSIKPIAPELPAAAPANRARICAHCPAALEPSHTPSEAPAPAHSARRCASGRVIPAPGGHLTPWMRVAPSTTSASSTSRFSLPSLAHPCRPCPPHARSTTLIAPTRRSQLQLPLCTGLFARLPSSRHEGPLCISPCFVGSRERASAVRPFV